MGRRDPLGQRRHFEAVVARRGALYWAERTVAGKRRRDLRAERILSAAEQTAGRLDRMLEIGCGTGEYTRALAVGTAATLVAIDVTPAALALRGGLWPPQVWFAAGDVERLPFADGTFDAVIGNAVLHHLRLEHAVPEIVRVLRPAGALVFAEPNMLNPQVALERNVRWIGRLLDNSPDETAFIRWRLSRTLRGLGVVDVRIRPFDFLYPLTPRPLIPLVERMGRVCERIPLVAEVAGSLLVTGIRPA